MTLQMWIDIICYGIVFTTMPIYLLWEIWQINKGEESDDGQN